MDCFLCEFTTNNRKDWKRHLASEKHYYKTIIFDEKKHQNKMKQVFREMSARNRKYSNKCNNLAILGNWYVDGLKRECLLCDFKCNNEYNWLDHTNSDKHIHFFHFFKNTVGEYDKIVYKLHQDYKEMMG